MSTTTGPADSAEVTTAPDASGPPCPYRLVDCDVHPLMAEGMASLRPFLTAAGQIPDAAESRRALPHRAIRPGQLVGGKREH